VSVTARRHTPLPALLLVLAAGALVSATPAHAAPPAAGRQTGRPAQAAKPTGGQEPGTCELGGPVIGGAINNVTGGVCAAAEAAAGAVGAVAGEAAGAAGNELLNTLARWEIAAATQVTTFVADAVSETSTPQLQSAWYEAQFAPMADLGAALGLLVALVAFASAAIRRSPQALAATLAGIARAGIGTGVVLALTTVGLGVSDQVSSAVVAGSPHAFWSTVAHAWGASGFGGFESAALAMLIALVEVLAAVFVWLELIVRGAAIYVAALFFPVVLAASIWPALGSWTGRLARLLLLFVVLKPVALIVLSLAGNAAAAGLSFGGGVPSSVGTILAAIVIFALAALAPWSLMYLLAADAESAYMAAGLRSAAGAAVAERHGHSLRNAGGLRDIASGEQDTGAGGGGAPGGAPGFGGGGAPGGGPSPDGGPTGGEGASGAAEGELDGTLPVGAQSIGAGSVGAAAGIAAQDTTAADAGEEPTTESAPAREASGVGERASTPVSTAFANGSPQAPGRAAGSQAAGNPPGVSLRRPGVPAGAPTEQPMPPVSPPPPPAADAPVGPGTAPAAAPPPRRGAVPNTPTPAVAAARAACQSAPEEGEG
jgi:hypothetical protein